MSAWYDPRLVGFGLTPSEAALLECLPVVLHEPTYGALFARGIRGPALTGGSPFAALHIEAVCFLPGDRFEFARDLRDATGHTLAIIIPASARGEEGDETVDLVAWHLDTGALATWRGVAAILGEDAIDAPRIEDDGLRVFPGPAEWLRADRRGVVVMDALGARWRLMGEPLVVPDIAFGRRLRDMLRFPEPNIYVADQRRAA